MDDTKLLELAGRAAGQKFDAENNPLERDDLALRLAVKLRIDVIHNEPQDNGAWVMAGDLECVEDVDGEGNRAAATRRAIVRAAAAIASKVTA